MTLIDDEAESAGENKVGDVKDAQIKPHMHTLRCLMGRYAFGMVFLFAQNIQTVWGREGRL